MYGFDCASGGLRACGRFALGAMITRDDTERGGRLLARLMEEVGHRQRSWAEQASRPSPSSATRRSWRTGSWMLLLVDGWEASRPPTRASTPADRSTSWCAYCGKGLRPVSGVLLTGDRSALTGQVAALSTERLILRMADPVDYSVAGIAFRHVPDNMPPGRGLMPAGPVETQVALLAADPSGPAQVAALATAAQHQARSIEHRVDRPIRLERCPVSFLSRLGGTRRQHRRWPGTDVGSGRRGWRRCIAHSRRPGDRRTSIRHRRTAAKRPFLPAGGNGPMAPATRYRGGCGRLTPIPATRSRSPIRRRRCRFQTCGMGNPCAAPSTPCRGRWRCSPTTPRCCSTHRWNVLLEALEDAERSAACHRRRRHDGPPGRDLSRRHRRSETQQVRRAAVAEQPPRRRPVRCAWPELQSNVPAAASSSSTAAPRRCRPSGHEMSPRQTEQESKR